MAQDAPDEFVFTGTVLEDQSARRMPELVHGDAQSGGLLDSVDDLGAERYSAKNIGFKGIAHDPPNMGTPRLQSFSAFSEEIVALIDGCNTRDRAYLVVQNFVSDMWSDAEPCHSGNAGSSQIMKSPCGNAGKLVELAFGKAEALK